MNIESTNIRIIAAIVIAFIVILDVVTIIKEYKKDKKINYLKITIGIFLIGVVLRTAYIQYTPVYKRQHDFEMHIAYIQKVYDTGALPKENNSIFYHQPLFHILSVMFLRVNTIMGVEVEQASEGLQILTAIYSTLTMLVSYYILKELNMKDICKIPIMAILAVHPTFIILAGSVNNDGLVNLFYSLAILYLIKWYKSSDIKTIIKLAFATGLAALSKISGTILALPIMYIFIAKLVEERKQNLEWIKIIKKYSMQFSVFGIIALGLGLSYSIRNLILFNQPIFYVPEPSQTLYCGDKTIFERFIFDSSEFVQLYCNPYEDCNLWIYLVKSSVFGEFNNQTANTIIQETLLILNYLIIIKSLVNLVSLKNKNTLLKMFVVYYIALMILYISGNISHPFGCTMDFRYIVPTIFIGMLFLMFDSENQKREKVMETYVAVFLFSILSICFELTYLSSFSI